MRGTYAEYISLPTRQLYKLPAGFDLRIAAASALVFQTAWHSLITRGNLRAGETVVIVGAGGGVNTASVQVAKFSGACVIVVGSDAKKLKLAESLGADVLIDRSKEADWSKAVYSATNKRGADIVVDNVGITFPLSFRSLCKGGRLLTVGNSGGSKFEIDNRFIFSKHLSIIGSTMSSDQRFHYGHGFGYRGKIASSARSNFPVERRGGRTETFGKWRTIWKNHAGHRIKNETISLVRDSSHHRGIGNTTVRGLFTGTQFP